MEKNNFKHELYAQFARVGKALSNPNRLELLEYLAQGERGVEALARISGLRLANTSQHLQQLRRAGLVLPRKEGQHVYYHLAGDDIVVLLDILRKVAEKNLAEVERLVAGYLNVKDDLEPVPAGELLTRIRKNQVTVVDVRPPEEYSAGHVPGAVNIPMAELEKRLNAFQPDQDIVAYCRGPHCILAYDAVAKLRDKGIRAKRLENGFPEWKAAGLPVEAEVGQDCMASTRHEEK
jgi:rhodanese-related sulfurtransferase/DNA-binding MarR family transcriptional regulator